MKYFLLILISISLCGCKQLEKDAFHFVSSAEGIDRTITLYSSNGDVIKKWQGKFMIEIDGTTIGFIDNNKEIKLSGTFIVEQN